MPRRKTAKRFKKPTASDMFLDYVASGNTELIEDYLDNDGDPTVHNCKGETALHIAAAHNQNDILQRLLPYFNEDTLDTRDMYGLPPYMTAIKHSNAYGAELLMQYSKMIRTKPYKFKNYNFLKNKNSLQQIINTINMSNKNPVIYPNQNKETINIWSYIPTRKNNNKSPFVLSYNNKNTKKIVFNNKKKVTRSKKKQQPILITRNN